MFHRFSSSTLGERVLHISSSSPLGERIEVRGDFLLFYSTYAAVRQSIIDIR